MASRDLDSIVAELKLEDREDSTGNDGKYNLTEIKPLGSFHVHQQITLGSVHFLKFIPQVSQMSEFF